MNLKEKPMMMYYLDKFNQLELITYLTISLEEEFGTSHKKMNFSNQSLTDHGERDLII